MAVCEGDLLVRLFMAEAVISRPGPQEPEKGLPGPDEDTRSAESNRPVERNTIIASPREMIRSLSQRFCAACLAATRMRAPLDPFRSRILRFSPCFLAAKRTR